jgi:hypothetical protein
LRFAIIGGLIAVIVTTGIAIFDATIARTAAITVGAATIGTGIIRVPTIGAAAVASSSGRCGSARKT